MTHVDTFAAAFISGSDPRHADALLWVVYRTLQEHPNGLTLGQLTRLICTYQMLSEDELRRVLFTMTSTGMYGCVIRHTIDNPDHRVVVLKLGRRMSPAWTKFLERVKESAYEDFHKYVPVQLPDRSKE